MTMAPTRRGALAAAVLVLCSLALVCELAEAQVKKPPFCGQVPEINTILTTGLRLPGVADCSYTPDVACCFISLRASNSTAGRPGQISLPEKCQIKCPESGSGASLQKYFKFTTKTRRSGTADENLASVTLDEQYLTIDEPFDVEYVANIGLQFGEPDDPSGQRVQPEFQLLNVHACKTNLETLVPTMATSDCHPVRYMPNMAKTDLLPQLTTQTKAVSGANAPVITANGAPCTAMASTTAVCASGPQTPKLQLSKGVWIVMYHANYVARPPASAGVPTDTFLDVDVVMSHWVQLDRISGATTRDAIIIALGTSLIALIIVGFLMQACQGRGDGKGGNKADIFLTKRFQNKIKIDFIVYCGFTVLELADVASDALSYRRLIKLAPSQQAGLLIPYSIVVCVSFSVSFVLLLVRMNLFLQLYRRKKGISDDGQRKEFRVLDLDDPEVQLQNYNRGILHVWVSVLLAMLEDAPLLSMNTYLLWTNGTFGGVFRDIVVGVVFGLMALGVRLSLFVEVSMIYEKKQSLQFEVQEGRTIMPNQEVPQQIKSVHGGNANGGGGDVPYNQMQNNAYYDGHNNRI